MWARDWLDSGRGEGGVLLAVSLVSASEVMGRDGRDDKGGNWINSMGEGETCSENDDNDDGDKSVGLGRSTNEIDDDEQD